MPNFNLSVELFNCILCKLLPEIWPPKSTHLGADCVILPELKNAGECALCLATTIKTRCQYLSKRNLSTPLVPKLEQLPPKGKALKSASSNIQWNLHLRVSQDYSKQPDSFLKDTGKTPVAIHLDSEQREQQNIHLPVAPWKEFDCTLYKLLLEDPAFKEDASRC